MKKILAFVIILLAVSLLVTSCDEADQERLSELSEGVSESISKSINSLSETTKQSELGKMSQEQVSNLFLIEYKVLEFSDLAGQPQIETALALAGQDRWDCFSVDRSLDKVRIFCKRRLKSVLRYFPLMSNLFF